MSSIDFLADSCAAGQTLVRLVSRGNAILAELLRLSQNIPPVFTEVPDPRAHKDSPSRKYAEILYDFRYLKNTDLYEERIESNAVGKIYLHDFDLVKFINFEFFLI
jgi:WASH complex subunit strumpellin